LERSVVRNIDMLETTGFHNHIDIDTKLLQRSS